MIQYHFPSSFLLFLFLLFDHHGGDRRHLLLANAANTATQKIYNIPFQYRMDVNETSSFVVVEDGKTIVIDSIEDGLDLLRQESIDVLTTRLDPIDGIEILNVITTEMDKDMECIPIDSKWCTSATSEVVLMVDNDSIITKPDNDVYEYAIASEVRTFVNDFNEKYSTKMFIEWYGPIQVTSDVILKLTPTTRIMTEYEQLSLQEALMMDTIITHIGGNGNKNIEITDTFIFVQELRPDSSQEVERRQRQRSLLQEEENDEDDNNENTNYVRVTIRGKCTIPSSPPPPSDDDENSDGDIDGDNDETPASASVLLTTTTTTCSESELITLYQDNIKNASNDILTYLDNTIFSHYFQNINMTTVDLESSIGSGRSRSTTKDSILTVSTLDDPIDDAEEDYPYWIIGMLCGVVVILLGTVAYGIYIQNKKKKNTSAVAVHPDVDFNNDDVSSTHINDDVGCGDNDDDVSSTHNINDDVGGGGEEELS